MHPLYEGISFSMEKSAGESPTRLYVYRGYLREIRNKDTALYTTVFGSLPHSLCLQGNVVEN